MVSSNVPTGRHHGAPKHGDALLAALIRCKRCGRKLTLRYSGMRHHIPRYSCSRAWMDNGGPHCIAFGGLRVDDAIEEALLGFLGPGAIAAATAAAREAGERRDQVRDALSCDLEAARYAADRAFRQHDAADPANRLVASELQARWNRALAHAAEHRNASPRASISLGCSMPTLASAAEGLPHNFLVRSVGRPNIHVSKPSVCRSRHHFHTAPKKECQPSCSVIRTRNPPGEQAGSPLYRRLPALHENAGVRRQ
ncbi:zinc ribbon domain-containing protein [Bradyrhizobium sp. WSM1417]|uniref:zinc ribbon domain-containing protein n=1 Tax=Bradyrhizobium sp. WSM1417 TaxID=754500 RepID=UPI0018DB9B23|nr:zinc ribbon domain-containing protein [Bradyrhizobium sp. WSM1417]